ncbi:class D sortase [Virgibacillus sp. C22-A2]|uniref:Class D sortase n=1 Tax=Virgibacillus tibetensis TaxID=3042313 RepID=A0ABU6KE64_9BACI|nr:class D sortase [Virgibacillus sp. C22-A2]
MKYRNGTGTRKRRVLLIITAVIIVLGLSFAMANGYSFFKGYVMGGGSSEAAVKKNDNTVAETELPAAKKELGKNADKELYPMRPEIGDHIGELYIPKLNAVLPIYHGTDDDELEKGVGHFAGSVLPGEVDNAVLSGHRDTVFRRLGEVGEGDELIVTTSAGEFTYKIQKVRIVDADDRTVIVPKPRATLTVSTCYPFDFIGSAPDRYILSAYLISEKLK